MEKEDVARSLARAVLSFQDKFMRAQLDNSPSALLCQVWLPQLSQDGAIGLITKGWPFCVAGQGDLLALFRCISCRFTFGVEPAHPEQLGAPGRVFLSAEPELACNVANYPRGAYESYLRRAEAEHCNVQSSMLLPVFAAPSPGGSRSTSTGSGSLPRAAPVLAVIEVVQTSGDMQFLKMVQLLAGVLESCQLRTSSKEEVMARLPTAATSLPLPHQSGLLGAPHRADGSGSGSADGDHQAKQQAKQAAEPGGARVPPAEPFTGAGGTFAGLRQPRGLRQEEEEGKDGMMSDDSEDEGEEGEGGGGSGSGRQRRRGGIGKSGKPGTKLKLEDLRGQFGVGLKEAATRLGICATTLKRACRRHSIQRWPHRALVKVNKALDEMEQRQDPALAYAGAMPPGNMQLPPTAVMPMHGSVPLPLNNCLAAQQEGAAMAGLSFGADTRWTTLANFIPAFSQAAVPSAPPLPPPMHGAPARGRSAAPNLMWMPAWMTAAGTLAASASGGSLPDGPIAVNAGGGPAVSVGSGLSGWEGGAVDPAAAALPRRAAAEHSRSPQRQQNMVPFFLQPGVVPVRDLQPAAATLSVMSGMDDPVVRLPGSTASVGPHCGISQLSLPSLGRDISLLQGGGSLGGLSGGILGGFAGSPEDVMIDASMMQFMLSGESQGIVNATNHDLQRLFDGSTGGGTNPSRPGAT